MSALLVEISALFAESDLGYVFQIPLQINTLSIFIAY